MLYWRYWFSVTQTLNWNHICRSVTHIFHGPVILPYILKTIWWTNVIIGILDPYDAKIYHIKCMWVSDLHFVVQWFWLTSWRRFDGGMLDWIYWFSVTLSLTYNYICRSVTYILWYSDSALYFLYYLMNTPHSFWWTSLILWILGLIWAVDMYFMIKWYWIIYLFLPIVVYWIWYENICECSKVRNRPVVYSRHETGASMYFGHISRLFRYLLN